MIIFFYFPAHLHEVYLIPLNESTTFFHCLQFAWFFTRMLAQLYILYPIYLNNFLPIFMAFCYSFFFAGFWIIIIISLLIFLTYLCNNSNTIYVLIIILYAHQM